MKRFLTYIAAFSCVLLLACAGIEFGLLKISNEYAFKRDYIERHGDDIKVLALGHSHISNGFNAGEVGDRVFNIATSGRLLYYDAEIVRRYVPHLNNIICVVIPLGYDFQYQSYRNVVKEKEQVYNSYYRCMFTKYWDMPYPGDSRYGYWSELLNSQVNFISRFFAGGFEELNECDRNGWEEMKLSDRSDLWQEEHLPVEFDRNTEVAKAAFSENLEYMRLIARVCKDKGVRLVVVTMPCYRTYSELMTKEGISDMAQCLDAMKQVYPAVEYYNFMDDDRFSTEDFFDSSHLSDVGTSKFARIFREEVLN